MPYPDKVQVLVTMPAALFEEFQAIHKLCPNMTISDILTAFLKSSLELTKQLVRYYPEAFKK
jgi:hypothetical protein